MFLFFAFAGTQVANTPATTSGSQSTEIPQGPNPITLLYISLAFAFSLTVNAWIFFRVSGGLFNPAVRLLHLSNWPGQFVSSRTVTSVV